MVEALREHLMEQLVVDHEPQAVDGPARDLPSLSVFTLKAVNLPVVLDRRPWDPLRNADNEAVAGRLQGAEILRCRTGHDPLDGPSLGLILCGFVYGRHDLRDLCHGVKKSVVAFQEWLSFLIPLTALCRCPVPLPWGWLSASAAATATTVPSVAPAT